MHKIFVCLKTTIVTESHMPSNPSPSSSENGYTPSAPNRNSEIASPIEDEVTRIDAVRHHAGVAGHSILSLIFLLVSVVLITRGMLGEGALVLGIAYGVALNGVTSYAWDRLREYFASVIENGSTDSSPIHVARGLSVRTDILATVRDGITTRSQDSRRVSREMKVELLATTVIATGLLMALGTAVSVLRLVGLPVALYLFAGALLIGILGMNTGVTNSR